MRLRLFLAVSALLTMSLPAEEPSLRQSRQCILVLARDWPTSQGTLRLLERAAPAQPWKVVRGPLPVLLGRSGLAMGVGQKPTAGTGRTKREGDGCSPAGVFALGTAFGFAPLPTRLPFLLVKPGTVAVDDARSRSYNQIVETAATPQPDWRSAEKMHAIPYYRLGLEVAYNTAHPVRDAGSCIFLHCFAKPRKTTSGCTALAEADLAALLAWLDPAAQPRLVQLPHALYEERRAAWALPAFPADSR